MKILITGGTGFVGQNLIQKFLQEQSDNELMLLCRNISSAKEKYGTANFANIRLIQSEDWNEVITFNADIVLHLAAFSSSANDKVTADKLIESNIIYGTHLLIALSKCTNLKLFVNTGSFAEYRKGPKNIDNAYLYSATKSTFRNILNYYANLCGFKYITAVPYSVYGGSSTVKCILDYMIEAIDATKPIDMTPGEQILDFIHVDDIAEYYVSTCRRSDAFLKLPQGYEFHLGTGRGYTLREVSHEIETITGKKMNINWGGRKYRERDIMYAVAPISYNGELGLWKSRIQLHNGLESFILNRRTNG